MKPTKTGSRLRLHVRRGRRLHARYEQPRYYVVRSRHEGDKRSYVTLGSETPKTQTITPSRKFGHLVPRVPGPGPSRRHRPGRNYAEPISAVRRLRRKQESGSTAGSRPVHGLVLRVMLELWAYIVPGRPAIDPAIAWHVAHRTLPIQCVLMTLRSQSNRTMVSLIKDCSLIQD